MNFKEKYPDFAAIESQVMAARVERAVYVSQAIMSGVEITVRGLKALGRRASAMLTRMMEARRDREANSANAFLKRSVPRY